MFGLGALLAGLSFLANDTQHGYYQSARELKETLESRLGLGDLALRTTPGMGSGIERLGRVGTFLKIMLVAIALVDIVGVGICAHDALGSDPEASNPVKVVLWAPESERELTAVVSQGGQVVAERTAAPGRPMKSLSLAAGKYRVSVLGKSICTEKLEITPAPLQLVRLTCGRA